MSKKNRIKKNKAAQALQPPRPVRARAAAPVKFELREPWRSRLTVACGFGLLMLVFYTLVNRFFPNAHGDLGTDYSYFCPALLDGYYWFHENGLFHVPWFTPSFCGGSLVFPNLQRAYYSVPQFLTFIVDPLTAIRITIYLFALLGGVGCYLLFRRAFRMSRWTSFLCGGLFLFNGFYIHRMIIGHFEYHTFMLLPLVALFLLRPLPADGRTRTIRLLFDASVAGVFIASMAMSDFVTILIPALLSVIIVGMIHGIMFGQRRWFWMRTGLAFAVSLLLSLAKLAAVLAFLKNIPRSAYLLPGVDSLFHSFLLVVRCLFLGAEFDPFRMDWVRNSQWSVDQQEWEYSLSFVPLNFFVYGILKLIFLSPKGTTASFFRRFGKIDWLCLAGSAVLLCLPVVLNVYTPWWNAFLKTLPLIQSSSLLFRWFILYIPCVVLLVALIMEKVIPVKLRAAVCIASLICCIGIKSIHKNTFYAQTTYDPGVITQAYYAIKSGMQDPGITTMGMYQNEKGEAQLPVGRNDTFVQGVSQIMAYESLFGYRLEFFPFKTLHPGPALDTTGSVLNVKNPASYLWPAENGCKPGDHFNLWERPAAEAFLNYKPFPFRMSIAQVFANLASLLTLLAVAIFQITYIVRKLRSRYFSNTPQPAAKLRASTFADDPETGASMG